MQQYVVRWVLPGLGGLVVVVWLGFAAWHLWGDHQQVHYNGAMVEAVRRAVLEKHPELAGPPPDRPINNTPAPVETPHSTGAPQ
jgi:hypothetical protein